MDAKDDKRHIYLTGSSHDDVVSAGAHIVALSQIIADYRALDFFMSERDVVSYES